MEKDPRAAVRERYAKAAKGEPRGCANDSCCGGSSTVTQSDRLGYSREQLASIPQEANLGLGCGNPTAMGELQSGETVVDLGSGGGIDCFLAARRVGPEGRVIGVDMTPEMLDRARAAAQREGFANVEFRLGEIENLPVADGAADVVISNCVINLSPEKKRVFREAYRILKPGGRLMVSDIVLLEELPQRLRDNLELYAGCISGAMEKQPYLQVIEEAGFRQVQIVAEKGAADLLSPGDPLIAGFVESSGLPLEELQRLGRAVVSIQVKALR